MYINRADRRKIKKRFGVEVSAHGFPYSDDTAIREAAKKGDELAKKYVAVRTVNRLQEQDLRPQINQAALDELRAWLTEKQHESLVSTGTQPRSPAA